jgi:hypothetical protein
MAKMAANGAAKMRNLLPAAQIISAVLLPARVLGRSPVAQAFLPVFLWTGRWRFFQLFDNSRGRTVSNLI